MAIVYTTGNLMDAPTQALVNPVNLRGAMGAGLAKAFADREPAVVPAYRKALRTRKLTASTPWWWRMSDGRWMVCLATKDDWRRPSTLALVRQGLEGLAGQIRENGMGVALPMLGCGLGGLAWPEVRGAIEEALGGSAQEVLVYGPEP